jgi:integrase
MTTETRAHLRRNPAGGWIADVTVNGKRRQLKAPTKAEAETRLALALEKAEAPPTKAQAKPAGFTIAQARDLSMKVRWGGTAYERTAGIYSQTWVDFLGAKCQLDAVGPLDVDRFRQHWLAQGNSPTTVNHKVSALKAMRQDAMERGLIDQLPPLPKQLKIENRRERVLSDGEVAAFCAYFEAICQPAAANLFVFLVETGCRWGEAERLLLRDVDLAANCVTFWKTKGKTPRTTPLTRRAVDCLLPHLPAVGTHRVWPYEYFQYERLFLRAKAALGLGHDTGLVLHSCRHTCASRLAREGVSLPKIMAWGGWKTLSAVERYMHVDVASLGQAVDALNERTDRKTSAASTRS